MSLRNITRLAKRPALWALAGVTALLLSACQQGAYQLDIFPEQHYQQSFKRQEPPRLTPPENAVPVNGREVFLSADQSAVMKNPCRDGCNPATLPGASATLNTQTDVVAHGAEVFRVNCSMCHGPKAKGDGKVGNTLTTKGYYAQPPNLTTPTTQNKSDGSIFWIVTNGVVVMPKFGLLLSEQDRWSAVAYLRYLVQENAAGAPK